MMTMLMLLHLLSLQNRDPRYFVEVINPLTSTVAAHSVKATMIREYKVPLEWFTERRELADYIMRIEVEHPKCLWTLVYVNPDNAQNVIVATKRVLQCYNCAKDLVRAAAEDWKKRPHGARKLQPHGSRSPTVPPIKQETYRKYMRQEYGSG